MRHYFRLVIALFLFISTFSYANDVGFRKMSVVLKDASEKLPVAVFYPTSSPAKSVAFGPFSLNVAIGGEIAEGRFPLAVLSHGSGGSNLSYKDIAMSLVRNGFIVAMPLHPKNNYLDNSNQGKVENYINRPKHVSATIDKILSIPSLVEHTNAQKIAVLGHSMGGYTALVVSGAVARTQDLVELCKNTPTISDPYCMPVRNNALTQNVVISGQDIRIKAQILMAPVGAPFISAKALHNVNIPTMLLVPEKDDELTEAHNADVIRKGLESKGKLTYINVPNAGHYSFLTTFPEYLKSELGPIANDPEGFDRKAFQQTLGKRFADYLKEVM
ncbi:alpha/beta hydrolase family protein [Vibrio penaeicida]|uniref:alpha/beta hydrolase family protein n=1 Tax=Vibrio penaeicida TaxID=104609 RepID=UPI000CE9B91E|nr:alpha/beta hydrolase [Vibrio penaeicida]